MYRKIETKREKSR